MHKAYSGVLLKLAMLGMTSSPQDFKASWQERRFGSCDISHDFRTMISGPCQTLPCYVHCQDVDTPSRSEGMAVLSKQ